MESARDDDHGRRCGHDAQVLHVEDNEAHAELLRRGFEDHRIANEIEHVMTGGEARSRLQAAAGAPEELPDGVLLDLRLPGI